MDQTSEDLKAQFRNNVKLIDDAMTCIMKEHGYRKKKRNWYYENDEVTLVVNLQQSSWGKMFYVNMGFVIKALEDLKDPPVNKCHFYTSPEIPKSVELGALNAENTTIPDEERQQIIREAMLEKAFPVLERWKTTKSLVEEYRQGRLRNGLLLKTTREFLERVALGDTPPGAFPLQGAAAGGEQAE